MPFISETFTQLLSDISQDFANSQLQLLPKSVLQIVGRAQAALSYAQIQAILYAALQAVPFTATGTNIDRWANLKDVYRKNATAASVKVAFTGVAGSIVPQNETLGRSDGFTYTTDAQYTINTTTTVNAVATQVGAAGNAPITTQLTLANVVLGVNSNAVLTTAITGGSDVETDDELRSRMLQVYAAPPHGGDIVDYEIWASDVAGVTRSWCAPNAYGAGTVVVFVMFDDANVTSNAATNGFPVGTDGVASSEYRSVAATGNQLTVANYIYPLRPVTALVYVIAPKPYSINITVSGLTVNTNIQNEIASSLASLYLSVGTPLGYTLPPSLIYNAIYNIVPTQSFTIVSPATNVIIPNGYLPVVGNAVYS